MDQGGFRLSTIWNFLRLTRPLFLAGGLIVFLLGASAAWKAGSPLDLPSYLAAQGLVTATQLMTHYANEFYDQASDAVNSHRTWFTGGSGVLVEGDLPARTAYYAAIACLAAALAFMAAASLRVPAMLLLGGLGIFFGWFYSAPPLRLVSSGWGELAASLVVTGLVPLTGYASQANGFADAHVVFISLSLGLIHMAMLLAFDLADFTADSSVQKRTLAVRIGRRKTVLAHNAALILALAILTVFLALKLPGSTWIWLAFPLLLWQVVRVRRYAGEGHDSPYWPFTLGALASFALTAFLWLAGFWL